MKRAFKDALVSGSWSYPMGCDYKSGRPSDRGHHPSEA